MTSVASNNHLQDESSTNLNASACARCSRFRYNSVQLKREKEWLSGSKRRQVKHLDFDLLLVGLLSPSG